MPGQPSAPQPVARQSATIWGQPDPVSSSWYYENYTKTRTIKELATLAVLCAETARFPPPTETAYSRIPGPGWTDVINGGRANRLGTKEIESAALNRALCVAEGRPRSRSSTTSAAARSRVCYVSSKPGLQATRDVGKGPPRSGGDGRSARSRSPKNVVGSVSNMPKPAFRQDHAPGDRGRVPTSPNTGDVTTLANPGDRGGTHPDPGVQAAPRVWHGRVPRELTETRGGPKDPVVPGKEE